MESYGTELKETPYPLIAALGAQELQTKVLQHVRTINEEFVPKLHFTSLPIEHRFPVKKEVREKHGTFPNQTQRDFDGYKVNGILKTRWLKKHHELVPAVVLLFHEFDPRWNQKDWVTQENVMKEETDQLKRGLSGRECRVLLILVQQVDDVGVAPVNVTDERLASLRKRIETDSKGIILLRSRDITRGSSVLAKLESSIRNYALEYYKAQSKRVKRYKKALNKTPHHLPLHVRHSFKIAHYYEFRRYTTKVLQHYEAAYRAVITLPLHDVTDKQDAIDFFQVKTMAEYINFKLCYHLIFSSSNIKAAVEQLQRHIRVYRNAIGPVERAFEHWEWVSRQYHVFAQLLSEAVSIRGSLPSTGLDSDVFKEPYLYFAIAAKYATYRRKAAAKLGLVDPMATAALPTMPTAAAAAHATTKHVVAIGGSEFVVVPSMFVGGDALVSESSSGTEPSYGSLVKYRYAVERTVPHAKKAIHLLEQAIHYLSLYIADQKVPRNRLKSRLLVELGMERLACNELERARAELQKAKLAFGAEQWWAQTAQILKQLVMCTFRQGDTAAFIDYSLQLLSPMLEEHISLTERIKVQDSFELAWRDPASLFNTSTEGESSSVLPGYEIILDHTRPLFDVQVHFDRVCACVRDEVNLLVEMDSHFASIITMDKIELLFSDARYNMAVYHRDGIESIVWDTNESKWYATLAFDPMLPKHFKIPMRVQDGRDLLRYQETRFFYSRSPLDDQLLSFYLPCDGRVARKSKQAALYLVSGRVPVMGKGPGSPSFERRKSMFSMAELGRSIEAKQSDSTDFTDEEGSAEMRSTALAILQPRAKASVTLETKHVLLTGDYRVLTFRLRSQEDTLASPSFRITSEQPPSSGSRDDALFFVEDSRDKGNLVAVVLDPNLQPRDRIPLQPMEPQSESTFSIIVRSMKAMTIRLTVHVAYSTKSGVQVSLEERFEVVCKDPFSLTSGLIHDFPSSVGLMSGDGKPKESYAVVGKHVNLHGRVQCEAIEPLRIVSMEFEQQSVDQSLTSLAASGFGVFDESDECQVLKESDMRSFYLRLVPGQPAPVVSLGQVKIQWRRLSSIVPTSETQRNNLVVTRLEIPTVSFVDAPLTISLDTLPFGVEGTLLNMKIHIRNNENTFHSVRIKPIDDTGDFMISGRTNAVEDLLPLHDHVFCIGLIPTKSGYVRLPQLEITSVTYSMPFANSNERRELFVFPSESAAWKSPGSTDDNNAILAPP